MNAPLTERQTELVKAAWANYFGAEAEWAAVPADFVAGWQAAHADTDALADALDRFFYDLRFTAPEAVGMRLNQLGERITPTMTELGYPKRGQPDADSGKAAQTA